MKTSTTHNPRILLILLGVFWMASYPSWSALAPPERLSYQGYIVDASGKPLGSPNPRNYDILFRVFDAERDGVLRWSEQQTVTVDAGHFSVLLGEGAAITSGSTNEPRPDLSDLFTKTDASERYVEMTVNGLGAGNPPTAVTILPRMRLLTSPYAFLATSATRLVGTGGGVLVSSPGLGQVTVDGQLVATTFQGAFSGNGSAITDLNADRLTSGTLSSDRLPDSLAVRQTVTAGEFIGGGAGLVNLNGSGLNPGSVSMDKLVAAVQEALCPVGTILPYAGDTAPPGWSVCDGAQKTTTGEFQRLFGVIGTRFGSAGDGFFNLPDLRGRFLRGVDAVGALPFPQRDPDAKDRTAMNVGGAVGDKIGSVQGDELEGHAHTYNDVFLSTLADRFSTPRPPTVAVPGTQGVENASGGRTGFDLIRNTVPTGGSETRPKNASVNFIIKH